MAVPVFTAGSSKDERRKRVIRLMQGDGLKARNQTVHVDHDERSRANLLDRQFEAAGRIALGRGHDRVCHCSISPSSSTCISRFVVGWAVSAVNDRHPDHQRRWRWRCRCPEIGLLSDQGLTTRRSWMGAGSSAA